MMLVFVLQRSLGLVLVVIRRIGVFIKSLGLGTLLLRKELSIPLSGLKQLQQLLRPRPLTVISRAGKVMVQTMDMPEDGQPGAFESCALRDSWNEPGI